MKKIFSSVIFFVPTLSFAALLAVQLTGVVTSFDDKNVVIRQHDKNFSVPRKLFSATAKFKAGEIVTTRPISTEEIKEIK
jgi:hypothetical protein